jgi:hypothetical protein
LARAKRRRPTLATDKVRHIAKTVVAFADPFEPIE